MSVFLSTLSLRRATPWHGVVITSLHHFYPRSPCGERRFGPGVGGAQQRISIHALLAESDPWYISLEDWQTSLFLSTLSLRRATAIVLMRAATQRIFLSTLSLRRATAPAQRSTLKESDFYPRSPCGERLFHFNHTILIQCISIHALLAESDATAAPGITACHIISIHALLAESDQSRVVSRQTVQRFLSTLSLRRATYAPLWYNYSIAHFYPRSPCGERHRERFHRSACPQFLSTLSLRRATWGSAAR